MKYDLNKILKKLESNIVPRSMRRMDLCKAKEKAMLNLKYELVLVNEPKVNRPEFVQYMFDGERSSARR